MTEEALENSLKIPGNACGEKGVSSGEHLNQEGTDEGACKAESPVEEATACQPAQEEQPIGMVVVGKGDMGSAEGGRRILGMERHIQIREGPFGIPMIQDTIIIEREPSPATLLFFTLRLVVFALILQSVFLLWSRCHKKSSRAFVLGLLYLFPFLLSRVVILLWVAYSALVVYHLRLSRKPYMLFSFFCALLRVLYLAILASQALLLVFFVLNISVLVPLFVLVVSVYFATLSRESVSFLSSVVHLPKSIPKSSCSICVARLNDRTYTLGCGHSFHSGCIKGWVLLGRKAYCPHCSTGIESMNLSFLEEKFEFFSSLLDYARSFIVFLLFMGAYFTFHSR